MFIYFFYILEKDPLAKKSIPFMYQTLRSKLTVTNTYGNICCEPFSHYSSFRRLILVGCDVISLYKTKKYWYIRLFETNKFQDTNTIFTFLLNQSIVHTESLLSEPLKQGLVSNGAHWSIMVLQRQIGTQGTQLFLLKRRKIIFHFFKLRNFCGTNFLRSLL